MVVNEAALAGLATRPATAFLASEPCRSIFRRAGPVADLTLDVSAGGKRDVALNTLLHSAPFLRFLCARARAAGDPPALAFALGLAAHRAADRVANAPGAVVCRNTFAWPRDRDPGGKPVADPQESTAARMRYPTVSLNKMMVDALLAAGRPPGADDTPAVDLGVLADAIVAYRGPGALAEGAPGEREAWETKLAGMAWAFGLSSAALAAATEGIGRSPPVRAGMEAALSGQGLAIPGLKTAVAHVEAAVAALAEGRAVQEPRLPPLPPGPLGLLPVRPRRLGPDRYELTEFGSRLYAAFTGAALASGATWESVKAAVAAVVPAPGRAAGPPAPDPGGRPASAFSPGR